jgi:xylulokinase
VKYRDPVEPDPENKKIYDRYYEIYRELYERTKDLMARL